MYDFKQDWFRNSGITENNDGCYEVKQAITYASLSSENKHLKNTYSFVLTAKAFCFVYLQGLFYW